MIIPPAADRLQFYGELIQACEASIADRRAMNDAYRKYYLMGVLGNAQRVKQNRLRDKIDLLAAFLYGQEATKFEIDFEAHVPADQRLYADVLRKVSLDQWHNTDADRVFGDLTTWSLVYGAMIGKVVYKKREGVKIYALSPSCFGVLREDTENIQHQEALCMTYWVTRSELRRELYNHPNRDKILDDLSAKRKDESATIPEAVNRIIISQVNPNMIGSANVDGQGIRIDYAPRVEEPLVEMKELWIWDDALRKGEGDYRVWTGAEPDITIYDRPNIFMPGEHPFAKVCPIPIYDYFWGFSTCGALQGLQDWRDKRLSQIDSTLDRQLRPSRIGFGATLAGEKILALDTPGGHYSISQPNAKIDTYKPDLPDDVWKLINDIDEQMNEVARITKTVSGRGEEGVRSEGHAQFLGRMSSAPIRKLALLTEDSLEDFVTLMVKCRRQESDQQYLADQGPEKQPRKFLLSQVHPDFRVRVSAHSSSPIFLEENRAMADSLLKAGAIDKKTYVEMLDPPMVETILGRLPKLEEAQAQAAKLQAAQEQSKTDKNIAQAQSALAKVPGGLAAVPARK